MKFYQIRSRGCGEMASDGWTDGQKDGRTDEAATICSPFWDHSNKITDKLEASAETHTSQKLKFDLG